MKVLKVSIEALVVGICTLAVGSAVGGLLSLLPRPEDSHDWNAYHIMELSLFLTGVVVHLGCEAAGVNGWYCRNGAACAR